MSERLLTVRDLAKLTGKRFYHIRYAIDAFGIEPAEQVGTLRLFRPDQVAQVRDALQQIANRSGRRSAS